MEAGDGFGVIRILVVSGGLSSDAGPPPMAVETTAALARLGDPVELLRAEAPDEIERIVEDPSVDLVLFDRLEGVDVEELLAAVPSAGPPSVVVVEGDSDEDVLAVFRAGASDCVQFGPEYEHVLPVVLLEQVQRWRGERQRLVSERRIRWLEDLQAAIVSEMPAALVVMDADSLARADAEQTHTLRELDGLL